MPRVKRGYTREATQPLVRDYKLFAIACEGTRREPEYFQLFKHMSAKIAVDIIDDVVYEGIQASATQGSAPRWVLDRAIRYIEREGLSPDDDLFFVMDVDRWSSDQLRELAQYCAEQHNWHLVLSNKCFEIWLYFHKKEHNRGLDLDISSKELKHVISLLEDGGYHPYKFIPNFLEAIRNARNADTNADYHFPNKNETKVYILGQALIDKIGQNHFMDFIATKLPNLISIDIERAKRSVRNLGRSRG